MSKNQHTTADPTPDYHSRDSILLGAIRHQFSLMHLAQSGHGNMSTARDLCLEACERILGQQPERYKPQAVLRSTEAAEQMARELREEEDEVAELVERELAQCEYQPDRPAHEASVFWTARHLDAKLSTVGLSQAAAIAAMRTLLTERVQARRRADLAVWREARRQTL